MIINRSIKHALKAARTEKIQIEVFSRAPEYSQFFHGGAVPLPRIPEPPAIFLGPMRLASFARWADSLVDENEALTKKVEALQQALYQLGRAAADAAKVAK